MTERIEFEPGHLSFDEWLDLLDAEVAKITGGFCRDDFRDWAYADAFDEGVEPVKAARAMLAQDDIGIQYLALAEIGKAA